MTQPQQQEYIITENMLWIWKNQCITEPAHTNTDQCKKCEYRGKGMRSGCCDFGDSDMEKIFRSRPVPSPLAKENLTVGMVAAYEQGIKDGKAQRR